MRDVAVAGTRTGRQPRLHRHPPGGAQPGTATSTEVVFPARADTCTARPTSDFRFASAVVELALTVTGSQHAQDADPTRAAGRAGVGSLVLAQYIDHDHQLVLVVAPEQLARCRQIAAR